MRAGELRQHVELQVPTRSQNTMNEWIDTFATQATVWGAIQPLSGRLLFSAQQANSEVEGRVVIRYRRDVKPSWRIKFGNRYFKILSIINSQEDKEELQLLYREIID